MRVADMTHRTPGEVRAKFNDLRRHCDPRGADVLDALENACLRDNAMLAMNARIRQLEDELAHPKSNVVDLHRYSWRVEGASK